MSAPTATRVSTGRALRRGLRFWLPVVAVNAFLQALLVLGDPVPVGSWTFAALVVGSAALVVLTVASLTAIAHAAAADEPMQRPSAALFGWTLGLGSLLVVIAVLFPWIVPVLLVVGAIPLTSVAARRPARHGWAPLRQAPARSVLTLLGFVVLAFVSWPLALLLGFFITGPVAAAAIWLWFGLIATLLTTTWAVALHRGRPDAI